MSKETALIRKTENADDGSSGMFQRADEQSVVLVDWTTVRRAESLIESCEHCNPTDAEIPFDVIRFDESIPIFRLLADAQAVKRWPRP